MTTPDRLQVAIQGIFDAQLDRLKYYIFWEYQVEKSSNSGSPPVVTCQLTSVDPRMPDATVVLRPGPDGSISLPADGSTVLVGFAGGDPSKPYIFATDPNSPPTHVWLAGGGAAVGRVGDSIRLSDSDIANIIAPSGGSGGPCSIAPGTHVNGTITSGSGTVESG